MKTLRSKFNIAVMIVVGLSTYASIANAASDSSLKEVGYCIAESTCVENSCGYGGCYCTRSVPGDKSLRLFKQPDGKMQITDYNDVQRVLMIAPLDTKPNDSSYGAQFVVEDSGTENYLRANAETPGGLTPFTYPLRMYATYKIGNDSKFKSVGSYCFIKEDIGFRGKHIGSARIPQPIPPPYKFRIIGFNIEEDGNRIRLRLSLKGPNKVIYLKVGEKILGADIVEEAYGLNSSLTKFFHVLSALRLTTASGYRYFDFSSYSEDNLKLNELIIGELNYLQYRSGYTCEPLNGVCEL